MATTRGLLTAADIQTILDPVAGILKAQFANLGVGDPNESASTLARKTLAARDKIIGDGTVTNPGIANADVQQQTVSTLNDLTALFRYDSLFGNLRQLFTLLDNNITANLPSGWALNSTQSLRALDLWLMRLNANNANVPPTPTATPVLTATTGGNIPTCVVGNAPRVKVTYASGTSSWLESQGSAGAAQVALAGMNNAYTFTLTGSAPVTGFMNVYRQLVGALVGDPYYYDGQIAISTGVAHPAYTLKKSDAQLRLDVTPPSWLGCTLMPEHAALFAMAYATTAALAGTANGPHSYIAQAFMTPTNVMLNPANSTAFAGINMPVSSMIMGQWLSTVFTAGAFPTANDATNIIQGCAGAANSVQARVTSVLNATGTFTITYSYKDANNPITPVTGASLTSGTVSGTAVDSTATFAVPAGRLVTAITNITASATATGTIVIEALAARSL